MDKNLPARPNLEHLRHQAKTLLSQLNAGDDSAIQTFIDHLPAAGNMNPDQVRQAGFRLADAQSAIARKTGFATWPGLAKHVQTLRQMEGIWAFASLEVDGNTIPPTMISNSKILIDGDRFRTESPEAIYEGVFTIDVDQTPHLIDIEFVEGPEAGNTAYGLFELNGDDLRICLGLVGSSRPAGFTTSAGSGHALESLRRISGDRPAGVDGGTPPLSSQTEIPTGDPADFEMEMTPLLERLQGDWTCTELVFGGQKAPKGMVAYGTRSAVGNELKVVFGGQTVIHAKVRIDESVSPMAVDYLSLLPQTTNQVSHGVMDWVGDEVRSCMAPAGQPRPTGFDASAENGWTLSQWKRK